MRLTGDRKVAALASFLLLGLSPSFIDWQQSDAGKRKQIVVFYGVATTLFWYGLLR